MKSIKHQHRLIALFILSIVFIFSSCKYFKKREDKKDVVARAFNYNLFLDDLEGIVPQGVSKEDSIATVKNFIDNWIRQKVVLHTAETNLDEEKKDVSKKLEEYRNSLIIYAYENELVRQKLDTNVSEEQIVAFYKRNPQNFELKDNIIKVIYLKLNKKSPKLEKVRQWYLSNSEKDRQSLTEYCHQYAINYFLDDSTWLLFDDLLKEIPIKTYDKEQYLQNNRNVEIEDSTHLYLINIKGFMIKNSQSPLSFERKNIITMIMNERKLKLIEEMENSVLENARKEGNVEAF